MSWLGKILTFLVLIGTVVWAAFTVNVYVTRTNWKVRADNYEKAFKESEAAREKEYRANQDAREALVRLYNYEKDNRVAAEKARDDVAIAGRKLDEDYKRIERELRETDVLIKQRDARIKTMQDELADTRNRNNKLEDKGVALVLAKEAADREALRAQNEAKLARAIADENAKKIETLTALVTELKQTGGGGGAATVLRTVEKQPAPLPENIRGTVMRDMVGDFVQISIGIDAGLEPGSRLDVYRESGGGKYLGTLIVTKSIYPKEAVAEFRPARPVPVSQLRPDELPRKGDIVGHVR